MSTSKTTPALVITAAVFVCAFSLLQGLGPDFDAASVKVNKTGPGPVRSPVQPVGRFTVSGWTLQSLLMYAYHVQRFQISGGPRWVNSDRFDVDARMGTVPASATEAVETSRLMLRSLLAARFNVVVRTEARQLPIYTLVMARTDRRSGPELRPSSVNCAAAPDARVATAPNASEAFPPCGYLGGGPARLNYRGVRIPEFVKAGLEPGVGRVVIDQTGLAGAFDIVLRWTPAPGEDGPPPPPPVAGGAGANDLVVASYPSIFKAVEEQLGLRLVGGRGTVDVLVIENAERPSAN